MQILNNLNTVFLLVFQFVFSLIQQGQINELSNLLKQNHPNYVKSRLVQLMSQSLYLKEKTELLLKENITSTDSY